MKDEPWRGNPAARCLHLERKLSNQKAAIRKLEQERKSLIASIRKGAELAPPEGVVQRDVQCWHNCAKKGLVKAQRSQGGSVYVSLTDYEAIEEEMAQLHVAQSARIAKKNRIIRNLRDDVKHLRGNLGLPTEPDLSYRMTEVEDD